MILSACVGTDLQCGVKSTFAGLQIHQLYFLLSLADCAVCEAEYSSALSFTCTRCSSSRRQTLMVATVIIAILVFCAFVAFGTYLLSTEAEERKADCLCRGTLRAPPLQAFKIIVVVWQILTQVIAIY